MIQRGLERSIVARKAMIVKPHRQQSSTFTRVRSNTPPHLLCAFYAAVLCCAAASEAERCSAARDERRRLTVRREPWLQRDGRMEVQRCQSMQGQSKWSSCTITLHRTHEAR